MEHTPHQTPTPPTKNPTRKAKRTCNSNTTNTSRLNINRAHIKLLSMAIQQALLLAPHPDTKSTDSRRRLRN